MNNLSNSACPIITFATAFVFTTGLLRQCPSVSDRLYRLATHFFSAPHNIDVSTAFLPVAETMDVPLAALPIIDTPVAETVDVPLAALPIIDTPVAETVDVPLAALPVIETPVAETVDVSFDLVSVLETSVDGTVDVPLDLVSMLKKPAAFTPGIETSAPLRKGRQRNRVVIFLDSVIDEPIVFKKRFRKRKKKTISA